MIAQIDARMRSRFLKGTYLPTLNIIISSKDTEQAFLDSYINTKKQNESKSTLIIDEPQWVVRPDKGTPNDPGAFYVAIGGKFLAHELLPVDADDKLVEAMREKGYLMMKVPPGFREAFEDNLDQALMDIAGYSTSSATKYISGVRLNQAKVDTYKNPFTKDVIEVGNAPEDHLQYANFFDLSRVSPTDMARPLFIHLDMSTGGGGKGDKTGIAGVWITGKKPTVEGEDASRELQYKLAFSVSIKAPRGYQISFEKNKNFIRWLRDRGFAIKGISSDTYQSAPVQQDLKGEGFRTEILSVDRVDQKTKTCLPYHNLKSAIYERRIQIYQKCDQLTDELIGLERKGDGHIDHTPDGINSKDQADAVCGAMYLASKYAEEYSYNYGDNLNAALEVSDISDASKRTQMITDFQAELQKIYMDTYEELDELDQEERRKKKEEYELYRNISDGIIII
jgi:DNA-binding transcriptional MerR regulator